MLNSDCPLSYTEDALICPFSRLSPSPDIGTQHSLTLNILAIGHTHIITYIGTDVGKIYKHIIIIYLLYSLYSSFCSLKEFLYSL